MINFTFAEVAAPLIVSRTQFPTAGCEELIMLITPLPVALGDGEGCGGGALLDGVCGFEVERA